MTRSLSHPCGPSRLLADRVATRRSRRVFLAGASFASFASVSGVAGGALLSALTPRAARAQTPPSPARTPPTPSFSEQARRRLNGAAVGTLEPFERERAGLLDEAERQLEAGQAGAALELLERAALMRHAADTELAIVRAQMAAGHYRRALASCAHTAGAHREQGAGAALYAWLLHVGGQEVVARRLLAEALERTPADTLLRHTREQIESDWPLAGDLLRQGPWHAAPLPFASGLADAAPAGLRVAGTAVLLMSGREALLTSTATHRAGGAIWLRNGLGQTTSVASSRPAGDLEGDLDLHLLELREPLPPPGWPGAAREPFAGSPGCMVEYAADLLGRAAWPLLRQGFFAGIPGTLPSRPLGLETPRGPRGGPVLDAAGRLAGIAIAAVEPAGVDRLIGLPRLREALGARLPDPAHPGPAPRVGPEVAYEHSLRGALQVLVAHGRDGG